MYQAQLALDEVLRLKVVRKMYALRFGEEPPARRSVEQLRGIEGARVRRTYQLLAQQFGIKWTGRSYDPEAWDASDLPNRCLSAATSCLLVTQDGYVKLAAHHGPALQTLLDFFAAKVSSVHEPGILGGKPINAVHALDPATHWTIRAVAERLKIGPYSQVLAPMKPIRVDQLVEALNNATRREEWTRPDTHHRLYRCASEGLWPP